MTCPPRSSATRLHSDPTLAQAAGRLRLLQLATRELPVELGIHDRHHVDPIDEEAAEEQVMAVNVESVHVDAAHRHTADIAGSEGGALEARLDEGRGLELLRAGIGRHRIIMTAVGDTTDRQGGTSAPTTLQRGVCVDVLDIDPYADPTQRFTRAQIKTVSARVMSPDSARSVRDGRGRAAIRARIQLRGDYQIPTRVLCRRRP